MIGYTVEVDIDISFSSAASEDAVGIVFAQLMSNPAGCKIHCEVSLNDQIKKYIELATYLAV